MARQVIFGPETQGYLERIRKIVSSFPETEEYVCFETPAFRVKKKLLARLREDGETLAVHANDRDIWINAYPNYFFVTKHYFNSAMVLVSLKAVSNNLLEQVLTEAWLQIAPKTLLKLYKNDLRQ